VKRSPLKRGKRLRSFNPERAAEKYRRNFAGPYEGYDHGQRIRDLGCCVPGCRRQAEASHVTPRGMGGAKGSWRDLVPQCREHHAWFGSSGHDPESFRLRFGVDVVLLARTFAQLADHEHRSEGSNE